MDTTEGWAWASVCQPADTKRAAPNHPSCPCSPLTCFSPFHLPPACSAPACPACAPALSACSYELFEEAFEIYKKFGLKQQAIKVVLDHMEDLNRAHEFATKVRLASPRLPFL